jgi:hypothetical protein
MIRVISYNREYKNTWDNFIRQSKNGVFLFLRDYMEYHADRFTDSSLMFFEDEDLLGTMPANVKADVVYSHGGLTFGGVVSDMRMKTHTMLDIFERLIEYLGMKGVKRLIYKAVPSIYHLAASQEDLYALFRNGAKLTRRDVTSAIYMPAKMKFDENRLRTIRRGVANAVFARQSSDFGSFMGIVETVLAQRHKARPVHTATEIEVLASRFPDNIKLFASFRGDRMLAGVLMYESRNVAHAQYIANSEEGRRLGALDVVFDYLISRHYAQKTWFDFGISTEQDGRYLNLDLAKYKEGYGARAVVHDFYEMIL